MGIELYWDDDNLTTLLCVFKGRWTWNELRATMKTIKSITDDVEHEIAAIIDIRKGLTLPGGQLFTADNLKVAKEILRMGEGGTGPILIVGANNMIRSGMEMMKRMDPVVTANVSFCDSVQDARMHLQQRQPA